MIEEYKKRIIALAADFGERDFDDPVRTVQRHNIRSQIDALVRDVTAMYTPTQELRPDPCATRAEFEALITRLTGCQIGDGMLAVSDNRTYKQEHIQFLWRLFNFKGAK